MPPDEVQRTLALCSLPSETWRILAEALSTIMVEPTVEEGPAGVTYTYTYHIPGVAQEPYVANWVEAMIRTGRIKIPVRPGRQRRLD